MNNSKIKICGVTEFTTIDCCIKNNVNFFGLIFYEGSPRNITVDKAIKLIKYSKNKKIYSVGVFVNKPINELNDLIKFLKIDYIQLHGNENNEYIKSIKNHNNINVIKVVSIRSLSDFDNIIKFSEADIFLFDYKPNKKELPGGNAKSFDWSLINRIKIEKPWFLSGGININNIKDIKKYAIPYGIDISSGVEGSLGIKSNEKISSLIKSYHESK